MRIGVCYFCSGSVYPGHGITFVRNDAKVMTFCRSKCHRNFQKKRNPRKLRWTKAYRKSHGKEMAVDSTFEFEKQRHRPVKYNRDLMGKTLRAMKRVQEIKETREARFYERRMRAARAQARKEVRRAVETGIDLIAPAAGDRERVVAAAKAAVRERHAAGQQRGMEEEKMTEG
mmetsp:Transcript_15297/g.51890  ORF Transcript_15297/g.51890 Transcript_15297/m.51890 type:complete len:173 (+) Transcript_15297:196-714(+)